jgi:hypothetical protein
MQLFMHYYSLWPIVQNPQSVAHFGIRKYTRDEMYTLHTSPFVRGHTDRVRLYYCNIIYCIFTH